jgi:hypothetical protein
MDSAMLPRYRIDSALKFGVYAPKNLPATRKFPVNYSDASDFG